VQLVRVRISKYESIHLSIADKHRRDKPEKIIETGNYTNQYKYIKQILQVIGYIKQVTLN